MEPIETWMRRALELARAGCGRVEPNPMVGALLARGRRILEEGFHREYGGPHAEIEVLRRAGRKARGGTLVLTLEPCSTHGKTPPCTEAILASGVRRVVLGARDPNPRNRNRGVAVLRRAGVEVIEGVLATEAERLLETFRAGLASPLPFLTLKWAMTLDGQIATRTGASRWISGDASRRDAHRERARSDGVLVGVGTVLADDPRLTVRGVRSRRSPVRIVADSRLRTPLASNLVRSADEGPVWILASRGASDRRARRLEDAGCRVVRIPGRGARLNLRSALRTLRTLGIHRLLLEGGSTLAGEAVRRRLVDRVLVYIGGRMFGGDDGLAPIHGAGRSDPARAFVLRNVRRRSLGDGDTVMEGFLADGAP